MAPVRVDLIVGARPNFVKAAPLCRALGQCPDEFAVRLVHTGQHYDADMSDVFFRDLELPRPDVHLEVGAGTQGAQTGEIIARYERAFVADAPRLVVVVGDVNSTMGCALVAAKGGARVAHVEAGLRSFDPAMPEEVNRVVTDRLSDLLFTPSRDADENLRREGAPEDAIFLVGNVMIDSLVRCRAAIERSACVETIGVRPGGYGVLTLHRPSNVDDDASLKETVAAIGRVQRRIPLVFPVHPRTAQALERAGRPALGNVRLIPPLGYLDFLKLVKESRFVLTDSGGVQEECTYLGVPCLTMRDTTERPITVDEGTNVLVRRDGGSLEREVERILAGRGKRGTVPALWDGESAPRIVQVLRAYVKGSRPARLAGTPVAAPADAPGDPVLDRMRQELKAGGKRLLARMPARLHEGVLAGHGFLRRRRREGPAFRRNCALLERSQWWTAAELRAFQAERLRALVAHAYATVPYYRALFHSVGLTPDDVREVADLARLPVLTKDLVRRHFDGLLSTRASRLRGHLIGTSGTTGTPLRVYWDHAREVMEAATVLRHRRWAGFEPGERIVALRGLDIRVPAGERRYWRYDRAENQLACSAAHMSDETMPHYLRAIRDFRPAIVWGYPSTVHLLAAHLEARGEDLGVPLRGVFLSSEPVIAWQRSVIEARFGCPVFDWYGLAEGVVSAGECERHDGHHVSEESSIVEIVPSETVAGASEIVATGLDNFMMPLIRYRTGDAAAWIEHPCACGRGLCRLGGVETKVDDMVVTPDGRWISPSVLTFPFKSVRGIVKSQLVQPSAAELVVRLVVDEEYSPRDEVRLLDALRGRLGGGVVVRVEYADDIPRTAAGKYRWVISEVRGRVAAGA